MTRGLAAFALRRLLLAACFVLAVGAATFTLARLAPGDATTALIASGAPVEVIAAERARLGLDRPVLSHLAAWASGLIRFDLGTSDRFGRPVAGLVVDRAINTAGLALVALALATAIGLPLGVLTGSRPHGWMPAAVAAMSIALVSCPPIVAALALLLLGLRTGLLPIDPGSLFVPALALGLPLAASLERLQSRATADALGAPDLVATTARGVPGRRLLWVHVARQSLRPVLGIYGLVIGGLFSGSLAVEWITSWNGLGWLTYQALVARDLYLIAGCAFAGAALIAAGNVAADVLRAWADPRVRETA